MTNEELILQKLDALGSNMISEIGSLKEEVGFLREKLYAQTSRQDGMISCQKKLADRQDNLERIAKDHTEEIEALVLRVNKLAENQENVIWKSKNGSRLGLKREPVYDLFDSLGIPRNYALTLLDAGRKLCVECSSKSFNHSKNVRIKGGPVTRAIVILTERARPTNDQSGGEENGQPRLNTHEKR
ncbi:MAG: hypothetical protein IKN72_03865 [Clostridia bacterium]|nr:hypothetical protein [Clostridia bacterium]